MLLGDRPALTPVETFYQRLLAHDADEVQEQAEALLKTRALSSYYDEVALKGLQLAASDVARGVLTDSQVAQLREELHRLIEELDAHDDSNPDAGPREGGAGRRRRRAAGARHRQRAGARGRRARAGEPRAGPGRAPRRCCA